MNCKVKEIDWRPVEFGGVGFYAEVSGYCFRMTECAIDQYEWSIRRRGATALCSGYGHSEIQAKENCFVAWGVYLSQFITGIED